MEESGVTILSDRWGWILVSGLFGKKNGYRRVLVVELRISVWSIHSLVHLRVRATSSLAKVAGSGRAS